MEEDDSAIEGPFGIAVKCKSFFDAVHFGLFKGFCGWYESSATCEGMDGGEFVGKWLVAVEWNILVCVGGFAIDIKAKRTVGIVDYRDIQHSNLAVLLNFDCPFDVRVDGVEVVVQRMDVVVVNGNECVVGFSQPEEYDVRLFVIQNFSSETSASLTR